jgi:hypothetical protein
MRVNADASIPEAEAMIPVLKKNKDKTMVYEKSNLGHQQF